MSYRLLAALLFGVSACGHCSAQESSLASIVKPSMDNDGAVGFDAMVSRGYRPLFNGDDLTGWRNPYPYGEAKVVDGEIHLLADNKFFLVTEKEFSDFRLSVDIHLPDDVTMAARTFDWLMENGTWPTEWAPHMVFMAHAEWMHSGNSEWLKHRYESLKSKTLMHRSGEDGLVRSAEADQKRHDIVDWPQKERDGFVFTEINTVVNAFHIKALEQMSEMARAIGKNADADALAARAELAKEAFHKTLFDESAGIYRDGVGTHHSSIHANFFPLAFGLIPSQNIEGVLAWLGKKDMACSPYAAQYFMEALFQYDLGHKALELITADGDRSWKHMVNSGTTISWEAWDLKYKPNQDWNHAWGAAPANLLPRFVLGVRPATPGWATAIIRPCPGGLKYASGQVPTPLGPIQIEWRIEDTFTLAFSLPEGMSAELELPGNDATSGVFVDGKKLAANYQAGRWVVTDKVTGSLQLEVK